MLVTGYRSVTGTFSRPGRLSALRTSVVATDDNAVDIGGPGCDGTVIIHLDRAVTCTDPMCDAPSYGMGAVLDRHGWFVACTTTLGSECPICRSP